MRAARSKLACAIVIAATTTSAFADPSAADLAFKKGRELLKAGDYAGACAQFEQSQALNPQLGTLFNIAQCDEKIGKLATALAAYHQVIALDTNATRKATASELAGKLEARVPKLVVQVSGAPQHLAITLDAKPIEANTPIALDVGNYPLSVRADGMRDFTSTIAIKDDGRTTTLVVPLVPTETAPAVVARPVATSHSRRTQIAIGTVAVGGAAIVTGAVFGVLASSRWSSARDVCGGTTCTTPEELDRASSLGSQAHLRGTISTAMFVAGGAIAAVGVVVWLTTPKEHAVELGAHAGPEGASLTLAGRF